MNDKIAIQYGAVYAKCAELCAILEEKQAYVDGEYARLGEHLQGLDGRGNAELHQTMLASRKNSQMKCAFLKRLLKGIELSARQVEEDEKKLKASYTLGLDKGGAV